jgi:ribose-phosphate pyrophosphokinase
MKLFALDSSRELGDEVAAALGVERAPHEEREFEDGEHKARPLVAVRGEDCYLLASLHGGPGQSPNDKLCRLLFLAGALRDAGAARVTAVCPYLCYSRKERKTKPRDPVTTRYVARFFEALCVDVVVTVDVHNLAAFHNAFHRCRPEHLEARPLLVDHLAAALAGQRVTVVSPDAGGAKRAEAVRTHLERRLGSDVAVAMVEKHRSAGVVSGEALWGEVEGRVALIVDDLVSTGGTLARAAALCRQRGAAAAIAAATHGLLVGGDAPLAEEPALDRLVLTDTVPVKPSVAAAWGKRLTVLPIAPLLAEAVRRLAEGGSLVELEGD